MKKIFCIFILLFILPSCTAQPQPVSKQPLHGVWITASELACDTASKEQYSEKITQMLEETVFHGITDIFVQVRPDCDALYASEIFPVSKYSSSEFDPLRIICEKAKENALRVHAWINPYRVSSSASGVDALNAHSPAVRLYKEDSSSLLILSSGIYLNPASLTAQKLILDGVREILSGYPVDGIHIDDYFYPPDTGNADKKIYEKYKSSGGSLSLADFRRANVNALVSGIYSAAKQADVIFSVSPAADIEKCRDVYYADVEKWCAEDGFCDLIIPQIYFGFENSSMPFENCLSRWLSVCSTDKLAVGLALYKQGKTDVYAGDGADEWINDSSVIEKQLKLCSQNGCGVCLFSYSFFDENS